MRTYLLRGMQMLFVLLIMANSTACETDYIDPVPMFDGDRAFSDLEYQVALGPRLPGSQALEQTANWLQEELRENKWSVDIQLDYYGEHMVKNVIAKIGEGEPWIILGAHYDTRIFADRDNDLARRQQPVIGANDGASGVAVLMELGRVIPTLYTSIAGEWKQRGTIWLVFFDGEDNGGIGGREWIMGSRAFTASLIGKPDAVVILDMIGDRELNIYQERNSQPDLVAQIWCTANSLGYANYFIPEQGHSIVDDHLPFIEADIPAVDIIDFDYPYWHTTEDTVDKVSEKSLQIVGDVILSWLFEMINAR